MIEKVTRRYELSWIEVSEAICKHLRTKGLQAPAEASSLFPEVNENGVAVSWEEVV